MIFEAAPDTLIGTNHWGGNFPIPWKRIISIKSGPSGSGKVTVQWQLRQSCQHEHDFIWTSDSYQVKITDIAPDKLVIGGQSFDVYGEPRTIWIRQDGSVK